MDIASGGNGVIEGEGINIYSDDGVNGITMMINAIKEILNSQDN